MALHDHCATARLAFLISDALRPVVHGFGLSTPHARYDNFAHKPSAIDQYLIAFAKRRSSLIRNRIHLSRVLDTFGTGYIGRGQEYGAQAHDNQLQTPNNRLPIQYGTWKALKPY